MSPLQQKLGCLVTELVRIEEDVSFVHEKEKVLVRIVAQGY